MGFGFAGCWLLCNCHGFGCCRGGFWVLKRGVGAEVGVGRGNRGSPSLVQVDVSRNVHVKR